MGLSNVGQNGVEEFFETLFYGVAMEESQSALSGFTDDVDDALMQDALQSAGTVIMSGIMFQLMRTQENFIDGVFNKSKVLIVALIGSGALSKFKSKTLGKMRGVKLFKKLQLFGGSQSDRIATANVVSNVANGHFDADSSTSQDLKRLETSTTVKSNMIAKESLNHSVAESITQNYNDTLLFKLANKSFTAKDKTMLRKILGRDSASTMEVEDMNKVADFMFVTDNDGNMTGLSEQFFSLLNGLGYMNK